VGPYFTGYAAVDSGKSAVLAYDLDTGALRRRYLPPDSGRHQLGDIAERRITGWRPLESATPLLTEPTHAVAVGGEVFFIADSGWDRLDPAGQLKPGMTLEPAHVLRLAVP
jgi:hypothetical protein